MGIVTNTILATFPVWVGTGGLEAQYLGFSRDFINIKEEQFFPQKSLCGFSSPSGLESSANRTRPFTHSVLTDNKHDIKDLINIRTFFSLNISQMAKIFNVSRPAIYAWLNGKSQPSKFKRKQIILLNRVAVTEFKKFGQPLGSSVNLIEDDLTIALVKSNTTTKSIEKYLNKLLAIHNCKPKTLDEELAELGMAKIGDYL